MSKILPVSVIILVFIIVLLSGAIGCTPPASDSDCDMLQAELDRVNIELVQLKAEVAEVRAASLEELLRQRRSTRSYTDEPLTQDEVMKMLWAGQGITASGGYRTAPSAGALYPLEVYVVVGNVDNLVTGIYKYNPAENELNLVNEGDVRMGLAAASLGQKSVAEGAIDIVIAAVYGRTEFKYGSRGERYVHIEVGHAAQNICLEATALGLGLVTIGAFDDAEVTKVIGLSQDEAPLYILPVGRID